MFQFPSNGKARVNRQVLVVEKKYLVFQFPSNGKARVNPVASFSVEFEIKEFQFPSNGKARVNETINRKKSTTKPSFNSLQTGRHV